MPPFSLSWRVDTTDRFSFPIVQDAVVASVGSAYMYLWRGCCLPPSSNPVVLKWHKKILRQEASEASRESRRQTNAIDLRLFRYRQVDLVVVMPNLHTHASNLFILSNDMKQTKISAAKSPAHIHSLRSILVPYTVVIHFFPLLRYTVHAIEHILRATV